MLRFRAAGTFAPLMALALAACVNPKNDYDDYLARTADADTTPPVEDAGTFDGTAGDAGFQNQAFVMACLSELEPTIPYATYFVGTATFDSTGGGNGTLDFSDVAIALSNNGASPPTSITDTVGTPATVNGTVVTGGKASIVFGPTNVPAAASPLGSEIVFTDSTLTVLIQDDALLCGNLAGDVTEPDILTLNPSMNICVFYPGTSVPVLQQSQFHCP